jgi:hypothetical protein
MPGVSVQFLPRERTAEGYVRRAVVGGVGVTIAVRKVTPEREASAPWRTVRRETLARVTPHGSEHPLRDWWRIHAGTTDEDLLRLAGVLVRCERCREDVAGWRYRAELGACEECLAAIMADVDATREALERARVA